MSQQEPTARSDFHSLYTALGRRIMLLGAAMVASLTPFTDTIYLPALGSVQSDLETSASLVAATVSIYMASSAIGQLLCGPLTDYYGRLRVMFVSFLAYLGLTVGCTFAKDINSLLVLRSLQGLAVTGTMVPSQAIIADIFAPEERGAASGLFFVPILVGPIIAPLIGGFLAQVFSWRATFVFLAVFGICIAAVAYATLPETHPFYVSQKLNRQEKVTKTSEKFVWVAEPLSLAPIWYPLQFLVEWELAPHFLSIGTSFAGMFATLTVLPIYLSAPPLSLGSEVVGICYLPVGIGMLIGSIAGGSAADISAARFPSSPEGRMIYLLPSIWVTAAGLLGFGFALESSTSLAAILIAHTIMGFAQASLMPSTLSFVSSCRPMASGAVGAALMFLCFASAAVSISVSVAVADASGSIAYFFVLSGGTVALGACITTAVSINRVVFSSPGTSSLDAVPQEETNFELSVSG